jgi:hypothetical protein
MAVYGGVRSGSILKDRAHGIIECSFGPIGQSGGREVIEGFGPDMRDHDGREVDVLALYHPSYANPVLEPHPAHAPFPWNFLEMEFDPRPADAALGLRIRNVIDSPTDVPRGGGALDTKASTTGRPITSRLPEIRTLPNADVRFTEAGGGPIRALRSNADGIVPMAGLVEVRPDTPVIVTAYDGVQAASQVLRTLPLLQP